MRCASYTRVTSCIDESPIPSDIISIQNKHIENYIKNRGWELVEKYVDRKKDPLEEAAFLKMKDDALGRKYECLVIDSFDRCGRTNAVAKELFEFLFIPAGISFAVVEDDFVVVIKRIMKSRNTCRRSLLSITNIEQKSRIRVIRKKENIKNMVMFMEKMRL